MTVYTINKRAFEQTNMTSASGAKATTAADAFAEALQSSSGRYSVAATQPNAESAMKASFDRPAEPVRPAKAPEKAEKPQPKEASRPAPRKEAAAAERPEPTTTKPVAKADKPEETEQQAATDSADDGNLTDSAPEETVAVETESTDTLEAPVVATVVQPVVQVEQVIEEVEEVAAETLVVADEEDTETTDQAAAAALQTADNGEAEAAAADEADFAALTETVAKAAKGKAKTGEEEEIEGQSALDQADQLADMLAGTNARVAVQVKVDAKTATLDNSSSLDLLMAQDIGLTPEQLALAQGQAGNNGASGQGTNNAGQQIAGNPALDNALAAQGKAADAKPFIAALAAQMEASNQPQGQQSSQSGQTVAGLGGTSGTQAAQKAQAPQAPHAPRQQQQVLQQQVMDQVQVQISKQVKEGVDTIKIQLKPVEMGAIEVKLDVGQDGRISGTVTADNKDTLAILQKDSRGLEKALEDAGYKTESGSLTFNLREGSQQNAQEGNAQGRGRGRRQGAPTGIDATAQGVAQAQQSRFSGSRSGVDIQV